MDRDDVSALICRRYNEVHGAMPEIAYSRFLGSASTSGLQAALGYRRASGQRLFLEAYLDLPIELELSRSLGRLFARHDIVEIGNLAADNAPAMVRLWADTANDLGSDAEVAVAALTRPLRAMFRRLGLTLYEIAPARPERLIDRGAQWGNYYRQDPVVCAGFIAEGQTRLASIIERRDRKRA
jgi:hypothetical protein